MVSNERILVMFNKFGKPVGDEGKELVQYLGTLVRMPEHVSIEYSDWRKVPMQQKEDMYSLVKSKFSFHQGETSQIKKWILYSMGKKWRTWKGSLKSRGYDPSLTIDEIVTQQTNNDDRVNPSQFKELVKRWFTSEFQTTCAKKRSSCSKMKEPHVTGTKSFARLAHEVAMKNDGVYPTRGEMYIKTRTRKDGSIVDDEAARVVVGTISMYEQAKHTSIDGFEQPVILSSILALSTGLDSMELGRTYEGRQPPGLGTKWLIDTNSIDGLWRPKLETIDTIISMVSCYASSILAEKDC
ncbi:hypothetical protein R6Q59_013807 [Mikania micrantha]